MRAARGGGASRWGWRGRVAAIAAVGALVTMGFADSAAASPRAAGQAAGHGPVTRGGAARQAGVARKAVPGSAAARDSRAGRRAERLSGAAGNDSVSGALSTVSSVVVHGGYTAAGVAMRNLGYGTISITGVPAGATVVSATLMWDILGDAADPTFAEGDVNGTAITGNQWAVGDDPCWGNSANFSYEADVTSLVTGNGSYDLSGFATGESDGADPWNVGSVPPMMEGASLVVVYQLASMPQVTVDIGEGAGETDTGNELDATFDGFTATQSPSATTTYIVADGQYGTSEAGFDDSVVPGITFPGGDPQAVPNYSLGNLWDTSTADVSSLVSGGDTSASMSVTGFDDCLVWVGQVLALTTSTCSVPSVTFGAYLATAEGGSCFVKSGSIYTDTGPVSLNGLQLVPNSGMITIDTDPESQQLYADDAAVKIGSFQVYSGPIPTTDLTGSFKLDTDNTPLIGELGIDGSLEVEVSGDDGLKVTGEVTLPKDLGKAKVGLTVGMDAADGLTSVGASVSDFFIPVGKLKIGLKGLSLSYNWVTDTWTGSATIGLPTPGGTEVSVTLAITEGSVSQFSAELDNIDKPLGPDGVFLKSIGANFVFDPPPASITGTAGITAGPQIDGASALEVDGSLGYIFSNPGDFQMTGNVVLLDGTPFSQTLANGSLNYFTDGRVTANGDASVSFGPVSLHAEVAGWVYQTKAFSLTGTGYIKVGLWRLSEGTGVISSAGVAACGRPFGDLGPSVGFGYKWGGSVDVMDSSCDVGPYSAKAAVPIPSVPTAPITLTLPAGLPVATFQITGQNGTAPAGTLTDPHGNKLAINPADQGTFRSSTPEYGLGVDSADGVDYIAVDKPAGGTWTFTPATGSAVQSIQSAQGLAAPSVSASVSGKNLARTLSWKLAGLDGRAVTFVEEGNQVDHVLASGVTSRTGSVRFAPADGPAGKRTIVAIVSQGGLTDLTTTVASYQAPATASLVLKVQKASGGHGVIKITPVGSACASTCTVASLLGRTVTLTPKPASGSTFSWTQGPCTGTGVCKVTLTQMIEVIGQFKA